MFLFRIYVILVIYLFEGIRMEKMLTFSPELYLGEGIKEQKLDRIKKRLLNKPLLAGVYILVLSHNPVDQLEILDSKQLAQHFYDSHELHVIGIAKDYDESLKLVERIAKECLCARGDCKLKEYLTC